MLHGQTSSEPRTAAEILALTAAQAPALFPGNADNIQRQWRTLAALWHPDRHAGNAKNAHAARAVFQHIQMLRDAALANANDLWTGIRVQPFEARDGRAFKLRYLRTRPFELGTLFLGRSILGYAIDNAHGDLVDNAASIVRGLRFDTTHMRRQFEASLPAVDAKIETQTAHLLVLRRHTGLVALADLLAHQGGVLDGRHIAWIVSGLENIACYLAACGLMHGAIDAASVFVDPAHHRVALLGGWFYATRIGDRLTALPVSAVARLPERLLDAVTASSAIDLTLIRALACTLAGDPAGVRLLHDHRLPRAFAEWLVQAPAATPFADYDGWETAREKSFGKRRFTSLPVTPADVYPPIAHL